MPVFTLGNIPNMFTFRAIEDEYSLPLIADAACASGAIYHDQAFGLLADLSALSFNGNKTITCGGAAVGCAQMEKLAAFVAKKRRVRQYYETELRELLSFLLQVD